MARTDPSTTSGTGQEFAITSKIRIRALQCAPISKGGCRVATVEGCFNDLNH